MSQTRKILLAIFFAVMLAVIVLTWGSIGSIVMTLALLLGIGLIVLQKIMESRDPDDFKWEE